MALFTARSGQTAYGYPIGIICAQWHIPFIPGDVNHAASFDYPVRYLPVEVPGAEILRGAAAQETFTEVIVSAARRLEAEGVRAITSNCGFFGLWQRAVADAVAVPVFMSSLLLTPFLRSLIGAERKIGVVVANSAAVTDRLLESVGVRRDAATVFAGLESYSHFGSVVLEESGKLDSDVMRDEVVQACRELLVEHPDIGALLLECSDLPVYSRAVHEAVGIPVFDWVALIDFVERAVVPKVYHGIY
ncbi:aspartate/glutamate racemase family protein [Nocardia crassostreae]|uniref:aspartate/glutamate racemase family protein n=1 Tax=Nocardia crassostreae TaxID=53428 RepID=UPI000831066E|nr:aspartate/glutamate racemase family protein [Nocardia crassostreae]